MKKIWIAMFVGALAFSCSQQKSETATEESSSTSSTVTEEAPSASSENLATEFTITASGNNMAEMAYDTKEIRVKAGSTVKFTLVNNSEGPAMEHNIVFCYGGTKETAANAALKAGLSAGYAPEGSFIIAASPLAKQGQTVEFEFTVPNEPGEHEFVCTYPGHWMTMNGKFIIVA